MFDDSNQPRNQSLYDLGIASAYMTLEANNRGLAVHQVGGFDREAIRERFQLSEKMTPVAILVIGKQAEAEILSHENLITREKSSRVRKDFSELILSSD